jgi:hypothetical protein
MRTLSHPASTHTHFYCVFNKLVAGVVECNKKNYVPGVCAARSLAPHLGALRAHVNVEAAQLLFTTAPAAATTTAQPEDEHDIFVALAPLLI